LGLVDCGVQSTLPIEPVLPQLASVLGAAGRAVLQAPPGAGKTTRAPLFLLEQPWLTGQRILLLEPRRVAARAAARRMAWLLTQQVGETVGYRIRRETLVSKATRIEVVTEGILTRMIQSDPALEGVGLVIFDEFHERSLHADLGLALTLASKALLRPDLRVLVMSATLDGAAVARLLDAAPVVTSEGRSFPVEVVYRSRRPETRIESAVADAIHASLASDAGDLLVFLPGAAEIHRTAAALGSLPANVDLRPLFGMLAPVEQDRAIAPSPAGRRKVVLATSIAETSLTLEGVRVVIDSGLARVPRYSPRSGMTRLATVRVSRASAAQRCGRAGRTAPGICYRLWGPSEDQHLEPRSTPEILESDLAPLALELAAMGVADANELAWLDPPPAAALAEGRALLRQLDAVDAQGRLTPHGRRMADLGTHPRLAHLLVRAQAAGAGAAAARLTALLEDRDPLRPEQGQGDADLQLRLDLLAARETPPLYHGMRVDQGAVQRMRQDARAWQQQLGKAHGTTATWSTGALVALAYPDRVGQRRPDQAGRFLLRNGQGAMTTSPSLLLADWIVAADLDGDRRESRIWLAAAIDEREVLELFADQVQRADMVEWTGNGIKAVRREVLGAIVLRESVVPDPDPALIGAAVLAMLRREGLGALRWSASATHLRERLAFLHRVAATGALPGAWPDVSDDAMLATLPEWLGTAANGIRRRSDLERLDLHDLLLAGLPWELRRSLDRLAPTHLDVPSGSRIAVDYRNPAGPVLPVRLQEVFGWQDTPRVADGKVPVTLHLLSPARRPVQVTQDLAGFWRTSYFDVRKEMKGRYPKHNWPENPLVEPPSSRTRKK
jgi:ATP-dependent helicase HrpB